MPSTQLINQFVSQTLFLQNIGTTVGVWFTGNGSSAYTVKSAYLHQGSVSVPVTVNGQISFQVPAMGRWSDSPSTSGFVLPGNVTLTVCVAGAVPVFDITPPYVNQPNILENAGSGAVLLDCNCTSLDGWQDIDLISGGTLEPVIVDDNGFVYNSHVHYGVPTICSNHIILEPRSGVFSIEFAITIVRESTFDILYHALTGGAITNTQFSLKAGFLNGLYLYIDGREDIVPETANLVKIGEEQTWRLDFDLYHKVVYVYLDGVFIAEASFVPYSGGTGTVYKLHLGVSHFGRLYLRNVSVIEGIIDRKEVTFSTTLFVSNNDLVIAADTLTINIGTNPIIYTFVNTPSGAANEIIIGLTAEITEANIALALNATDGAIFTATTSSEESFEWTINTDYTAETSIKRNNGILYICLVTHTSASDSEPGVGVNWEQYWMVGGVCTDWVLGTVFAASSEDVVVSCVHGGYLFISVTEHTASSNTEPLAGEEWESVWLNTGIETNTEPNNHFVSVIVYTSETVTISTTSAGLTLSYGTQHINHVSSSALATLPAFTGNGFCDDGTAFLPAFTAAGTCTHDDFCIGRGVLPATTCNAQSFILGLNYDSTKPEKISLLLNGNGFMQSFAPMVCVTDPDEAALLAVQFVANYITYTADVIVWGTTESWVCPRGTLYYALGDCEDGSFLIASLLLNIGVSSSKVKVAIGYYDDTGHAWAMYQRASDDNWVNLDWTKGSTYWNAISSVDELPIAFSEA